MSKARCKAQMKIPTNLMEYGIALESSDRYGHTMQGGQFYRATLVDEDGDTAVVFVSPTIEERLSPECTHVQVDATFKVTKLGPQYYQLLTLSVFFFDHAFPLVNALMSRKTEALYNLLFNYLVTNIFPNWAPLVITTDFESVLQNSLRRIWNDAHIVGSWYHSANCIINKIYKLGHANLLMDNADARKAVKMCQVLPLLPDHLINAGYDYIVEFAERKGVLLPLITFLNYVFRVWITGVGVKLLSMYKQRQRTNNYMELYHRRLRSVMSQLHYNIWVFTGALKWLENNAAHKLVKLTGVVQNHLRSPSYLLANRVIVNLSYQLNSKRGKVGEFLEAASYQIEFIQNEPYNHYGSDDSEDESIDGLVPASLPLDSEQLEAALLKRRGPRARTASRDCKARAARRRQNKGAATPRRETRGIVQERNRRGRGTNLQTPKPQLASAEHSVLLAAAQAITAAAANIPAAASNLALAEALQQAAVALTGPLRAAEPNPPADLAQGSAASTGPSVDTAPQPSHATKPANNNPSPGIVLNPCLICLEHRRDMMIAISCGHVAVCEDCATQLQDQRCVACREPIVALHKIAIMN